MDPRLRAAVSNAAPRIAAAVLHKDTPQLDRELRRLENQCGYVVAKRALDVAVHSPEALTNALAKSATGFARAAISRDKAEATAAAVYFVESLLGEGAKLSVRAQLRRVPVSHAVKQAFVSATPGAVLAVVREDAHLGRNVAAHLAADVVRAKAAPHIHASEDLGKNLVNAALQAAPSAALAAVRQSRGDAHRAVLEFVGRAGVVTVDHVADRFIKRNAEDIFAVNRSASGLVKGLVMHQWLQSREMMLPIARSLPGVIQAVQIPQPHLAVGSALIACHPVFRQAWTHVIYTTPRAAEEYAVPLPPDIRRAFIPHYLRTMDACLALEKRFEQRGFEVLTITGENQLIRENFQGKIFKKGLVLPNFPDAQLLVRGPDGGRETINVEYVTKSYTSAMIRDKANGFVGPTVWAVDSHSTAANVRNNAGNDAEIILV